jgi:DNA invertase Pin-like site-specific DNA recombinase
VAPAPALCGIASPIRWSGAALTKLTSGAVTDRKALAVLKAGDMLIVTRLDRLARSSRDLVNTLDTVARTGAGFKSPADTWADITTPRGRMMLTVLGGLADFERELTRARTGEGRACAKARL